MYSRELYEQYKVLLALGLTTKKISDNLNIPKLTIDKWRQGINIKHYENKNIIPKITIDSAADFFTTLALYNKNTMNENIRIYSFLLSLYLGDGCMWEFPRCIKISYALDVKYDRLNDYVVDCLTKFFGKPPSIQDRRKFKQSGNCLNIESYDKNLKEFFPHHGSGNKHLRKIELKEWQINVVDPGSFVKGLVYSDGCYVVRNTGQTLYEIVNASIDIINICSSYLHQLGIHHNIRERVSKIEHHAKIYKINIYGKSNVEKLHNIIGDKHNVMY